VDFWPPRAAGGWHVVRRRYSRLITTAAADFANIGSAVGAANAAALAPTSSVLAAAGDEVSGAIATLFATQGQAYQAIGAQAAAFHQQFVQLVNAGAASYASAEAANATPLQSVQDNVLAVINAPTQAVLGRPLIGDGANATVAGGKGGDGGLLFGKWRQRRSRRARPDWG
jgi:hypothetical protein